MITVVIPCAGKGERLGSPLPKQFLPLKGIPILVRTLLAFENHPQCEQLILAVSKNFLDYTEELLKKYSFKKFYKIVEGGETRQESVFKAVACAPKETRFFLIHDAVRPLVSKELISKIIEEAKEEVAVIPVLPVRDALIMGERRRKKSYLKLPLDRENMFLVQTPQVISANILIESLKKAQVLGINFPDEGSLLQFFGYKVRLTEGAFENIKITYKEDLLLAERLIPD